MEDIDNTSNSASFPMLVDAKTEYTKQLTSILKPFLYDGIKSIYDDCKVHCTETNNINILLLFQENLSKIPKWNQDIIDTEVKRIIHDSECDWLDDLVTAVFVSHTKILTSIQVRHRKKKINLNIPKIDVFIHKCYIECAREFWKNPYLFQDNIDKCDYQRNMRDCENIVSNCICETIRKLLPVKHILQEYLGDNVNNDDDDETEDISKFNSKNLKMLVQKEIENYAKEQNQMVDVIEKNDSNTTENNNDDNSNNNDDNSNNNNNDNSLDSEKQTNHTDTNHSITNNISENSNYPIDNIERTSSSNITNNTNNNYTGNDVDNHLSDDSNVHTSKHINNDDNDANDNIDIHETNHTNNDGNMEKTNNTIILNDTISDHLYPKKEIFIDTNTNTRLSPTNSKINTNTTKDMSYALKEPSSQNVIVKKIDIDTNQNRTDDSETNHFINQVPNTEHNPLENDENIKLKIESKQNDDNLENDVENDLEEVNIYAINNIDEHEHNEKTNNITNIEFFKDI